MLRIIPLAAAIIHPFQTPPLFSEPATAPDEQTLRAYRAFESGRFTEAALEFEDLAHKRPGDPRLLYNAAVARYALQHHAHAVRYLDRYLASPHTTELREEAEAQRAAARLGTATAQLRLRVEGATSLRLDASFAPESPADLRPPLQWELDARRPVELALDPGTWKLRLTCPDRPVSSDTPLVVREGAQTSLELHLDCRPAPPPPPPRNQALALALGVVGGSIALGGALLGGVSLHRRNEVLRTAQDAGEGCEICWSDTVRVMRRASAGLALVGVGAGLVAGMSSIPAPERARRPLAWAGLGLGGLFGALGLVGHALALDAFNDRCDPGAASFPACFRDAPPLKSTLNLYTVSDFGLGFGLGLVTASTLSLTLVRDPRRQRAHAAPWIRGGAGVLVSVPF